MHGTTVKKKKNEKQY